ncbi:MAG: hypothetical protein ABL914_02420 [Novosphingobium sp.]|uniref:hypothetical protein n=1 Tax=Novosphingobium sp. TaxID=1874826 RepID=UPI0032BAFE71
MLRGALILLSGLALGGLSAVSGLDRMARTDPAIAAQVPTRFASAALRTLGGQALAARRSADAAAYGWHAIDRSPVNAEAVALFAAGNLGGGNTPLAQRAFRLAGRMGWRVPITQAYWLNQALEARDYDAAAMRLDALLRQQPTLVGQQALIDPVERNPEARAALVERLDLETAWLGKYLNEVFDLPPEVLRQRGWVLVDAARAGFEVGCDASANLAAAMIHKRLYQEARELWAAQCPEAGNALLGDEGFAALNLQGARNPFGWQIVGNGDVLLSAVPLAAGNGQRLAIDGTPPVMRRFLAKLLLLASGRYQLSWLAGKNDGKPSDKIRAALSCKGQAEIWLEPQLDRASGRWFATTVVPADCPEQRLSFALAAGAGSVWLEDVSLDPIP